MKMKMFFNHHFILKVMFGKEKLVCVCVFFLIFILNRESVIIIY